MPSLAPGQTFRGGGQFGGGQVGGGISGTVTAITATTMTIQESNGTTVTIDLASGTTYHGQAAAVSSDVKAGSTVTVQVDNSATTSGSPNPGASGTLTLTAKDILVTQP
jgi:preprotein translocase subunit YajC